MLQSIVLLSLLLHATAAEVTIKTSSHPSDVLKVKCDSLPYRTAYFEQICYFVIDDNVELGDLSSQCSMVMRGAHRAGKAPDAVWHSLFVDKNEFMLDGESTGKKKAMCIYECPLVYTTESESPSTEVSKSRGETPMTARMHMPFRLPFAENVEPGQTIIIKGTTTAATVAFNINLQSGGKNANQSVASGADFPLHIGVRINTGTIILAALVKGKYSNEKNTNYKNPYKKGDSFDIRIRVEDDRFQVFVEQKQLAELKFRLPLSLISHLYIYTNENSTYLNYVQLGEKYKPVPYSTTVPAVVEESSHEVQKYVSRMYTPYLLPFTEKLASGQTLILKGVISASAVGLMINLQSGSLTTNQSRYSGGDIPFHMGFGLQDGKVILGTLDKGKWNTGENKLHPLKKGDSFEIQIRINDNGFKVFVNEKEFGEYKFRLPLSLVSHLYIYTNERATYLTSVQLDDKIFDEPLISSANDICQGEQQLTARTYLPYLMPFADKVEPGMSLLLKGFITASTKGFHINFQSGSKTTNETRNEGGDIPFHMGFGLQDGEVILGTLDKGKWNTGENKLHSLKKGSFFDIRIHVRDDGFKVFVNRKEFGTYKHQLPLSLISHLYVYTNEHTTYLTSVQVSTKRINLPFLMPFTEKLESGRTLFLKGTTTSKTIAFNINLQSGTKNTNQSVATGADIPFHIGVRLNTRVIVLVTMTRGKWGEEKFTYYANPYKPGDSFDIQIRVKDDRFQVFLENKELAQYKFRMPLSRISHLYVYTNENSTYLNCVQLGHKYYIDSVETPISFPSCSSKQSSCVAVTHRELFTSRAQVVDCKTLTVSGVVETQSFSIKLIRKEGDVALLFLARFDRNNVGLNSFKNGQWQNEETIGKNPFKNNVRFDVTISNEARGFEIFVNGAYFATFDHRTCSYDIILIEVQGVLDLNIQV